VVFVALGAEAVTRGVAEEAAVALAQHGVAVCCVVFHLVCSS